MKSHVIVLEAAATKLREQLLASDSKPTWYAKNNDLIGGWCVTDVNETPGESGRPEVADFLNREDADLIVTMRAAAPGVLFVFDEAIRDFHMDGAPIQLSLVRVATAIVNGRDVSL